MAAKLTITLWIARKSDRSFQFWGTKPKWDKVKDSFYVMHVLPNKKKVRRYHVDSCRFIRSVCAHAILDMFPFAKVFEIGSCYEISVVVAVPIEEKTTNEQNLI